jgi:hypothetical protein
MTGFSAPHSRRRTPSPPVRPSTGSSRRKPASPSTWWRRHRPVPIPSGEATPTYQAEHVLRAATGIDLNRHKGPGYREIGQAMDPQHRLRRLHDLRACDLDMVPEQARCRVAVEGDQQLFNQRRRAGPGKASQCRGEARASNSSNRLIFPRRNGRSRGTRLAGSSLVLPECNDLAAGDGAQRKRERRRDRKGLPRIIVRSIQL